jgi:probable HAF family extracellular repeat protein
VYQNGYAAATVWQGGVAQPLGTLGGSDSYATAINERGQVTGSAVNAAGQGRAFLYDEGALANLGALPGWQWSAGNAVNDAGQVAGSAQLSNGRFRGFVWDRATGLTQLGTLGGRNSYAMDISDAGMVVGSSTLASGWAHAFLWNGSTMTDLGTLGGGNSGAYGINASGDAVGYSDLPGGGTAAFLFGDGVMHDLNALLASGFGWQLLEALAINDAGQIVGTGRINGELHAYRLDPSFDTVGLTATTHSPEPGTLAMMLLGAGLLATGLYRRRRR